MSAYLTITPPLSLLVFGDSLQVPLKTDGEFTLFDVQMGLGNQHHRFSWLSTLLHGCRVIANNGESMGVGANALEYQRSTSGAWRMFNEASYTTGKNDLTVFALGTNNLRHDWIPACHSQYMALIGFALLKYAPVELSSRSIDLSSIAPENFDDAIKVAHSFLSLFSEDESLADRYRIITRLMTPEIIREFASEYHYPKMLENFLESYWCDDKSYKRLFAVSAKLALVGFASSRSKWIEQIKIVINMAQQQLQQKLEKLNRFDLPQLVIQLGNIALDNDLLTDEKFKAAYKKLVIQTAILSDPQSILEKGDLIKLMASINRNPVSAELNLILNDSFLDSIDSWFPLFQSSFTEDNLLFVSPFIPVGTCFGSIPLNQSETMKVRIDAVCEVYNDLAKALNQHVVHLNEFQAQLTEYLKGSFSADLHTPAIPDGTHLTTLGTTIANIAITAMIKQLAVHKFTHLKARVAIDALFKSEDIKDSIDSLLTMVLKENSAPELHQGYTCEVAKLNLRLTNHFSELLRTAYSEVMAQSFYGASSTTLHSVDSSTKQLSK